MDEALDTIHVAVNIRRHLYLRDSAGYSDPLARSLYCLSDQFIILDRKPEALLAATEGLRVISASLQNNPVVHAEIAHALRRRYELLKKAQGEQVDRALLAPIEAVLERLHFTMRWPD